ncbi:hypothetical protein [Novosphingobium huizhouense]|uniref:hypothetical protein n=1 Tax=Novosphingobium huizhouense TaxID=2866625 RepID=UPI001CD8CD35|nr:hypothetical protein [Novosphingobium huizhouense]
MRTIVMTAAASAALVAPLAVRAADAAAFVGPASAIEERNVLSGKEKLDPTAGYILVTGATRQFGMFLRAPDDATRAEWEKDRQKAFAKEHRRYESDLAAWKTAVSTAQQTKTNPPPQPKEPSLETFEHAPIALQDVATFGPQFAYAKGASFAYLEKVRPGTYIWYGNVMGGNGYPAAGTCMCMGTVQFEVKPGVVTDLGNALQALPQWNAELDVARLRQKEADDKRVAAGKAPAPQLAMVALQTELPASLAGWPSVTAEFHASPKINNYYGIFVSRLPPVPGVLGYRRDVVVDARTGQDIDSPTLVSRQKPKL